MSPSLQSPMHGYRLRHLSARVALQPCTYSTGDCFITTFLQTSSAFMDDIFYKVHIPVELVHLLYP